MQERLRGIGEVSRLTGMPVKTVRYYAEIGLVPPAEVTEARYRMYSAREIWRLEVVRTLRRLGFGLSDVRKVLAGEVPVGEAIGLQLDAVAGEIRTLTRLHRVLEHARDGALHSEEHSLEHLHDIGTALAVADAERSRFLAERLMEAIARGSSAPEDWRERFLANLTLRLPEELSPEEAVAWTELVRLLDDPRFVESIQQDVAPFWQMVRERDLEAGWWNDAMASISERALAAIHDGAGPESDEVQEIVEDWGRLFASAAEQPYTQAFLEQMARSMIPSLEREHNRRLWDLLSRLDVSGAIAAQDQVNRLMLAGLRWKVGK